VNEILRTVNELKAKFNDLPILTLNDISEMSIKHNVDFCDLREKDHHVANNNSTEQS
jgi:hypothetical protein